MSTRTQDRPMTPTDDTLVAGHDEHGHDVGDTGVDTHDHGSRGWMWLSAVLAIALVAVTAWMIIDDDGSTTSDVAPTDEVAAVVEDYRQAWNDYDNEAFRALVTDDYQFVVGDSTYGADWQASRVDDNQAVGFQVGQVGDGVMAGDGPWYVAVVNELTTSVSDDVDHGISIFTIVDDDGTLRLSQHRYIGEG